MSEYADDYNTVQDDVWRVARKEHRCDACGETIAPGHRYHRTFVVFDGDPDWANRCVRCQAIFDHLTDKMVGNAEEFCNWKLACGHEYRERWGEDPPPEIAALAFWRPGDPLPEVKKP
jgi:hypothetical protein